MNKGSGQNRLVHAEYLFSNLETKSMPVDLFAEHILKQLAALKEKYPNASDICITSSCTIEVLEEVSAKIIKDRIEDDIFCLKERLKYLENDLCKINDEIKSNALNKV